MLLGPHLPTFMCFGQFSPNILSLQQQRNRRVAPKSLCITEQFGERRAGAGGDHVEWFRRRLFDARNPNFDPQRQPACNCGEKIPLLLRRFVQHYTDVSVAQQLGQNQTWKPRAAAKID